MKKYYFFVLILMIFVLISIPVRAELDITLDQDGNNVVKIMGDIHIPEERVVTGDVVAILGDIKVDGRVGGDVVAIMGDIELNNEISGNLISIMGKVIEGPEAAVMGSRSIVNVGDINIRWPIGMLRFVRWNYRIFQLFILFGLAVVVFSMMPQQQRNMAQSIEKAPVRKLLIGFISFLILPVIFVLFLISIIGIPFIPFLIITIVIFRFIGYVAIVYFAGNRITAVGKLEPNIYLKLLIGVAALWVLNMVPLFDILFYLLLTFLALGTIIDTRFGTNKPWFNRSEVVKEK